MKVATLRIGGLRAAGVALGCGLALLQTACLILPARYASGVEGSVVDAGTGRPLADAIVVVRFDGRNGDVLPDRRVLGYREAVTDAQGHFAAPWIMRSGISIWPIYRTDARVVAVMKDGYRCPKPVAIRGDAAAEVALEPAVDIGDRRATCRPVPAKRGEAERYTTAWRDLFPAQDQAYDVESRRELARVLEARAVLGFGQNCDGPVTDLALAPDGLRAAYSEGRDRSVVKLVGVAPGMDAAPEFIAEGERSAQRRLAWTSTGDLALWTASDAAAAGDSTSGLAPDQIDVVWKARQRRSSPAAPDFSSETPAAAGPSVLEPADLSDEGDSRWLGRSFLLERALDTQTGLARERLVIVSEDGERRAVTLPGEACGPTGRFGRPHYRITASGDSGIDLRYVDGGCHALQIDFATGKWRQLDSGSQGSVCQRVGNIPATHLEVALRGYARDVREARIAAGGDPAAAYALTIAADGSTAVETRNFVGEVVTAKVPDFPVSTPLERIQVSIVGAAGFKGPAAPATNDLNPL